MYMNKYDNFCIYKIHHKDDDKTLYIGSTTNYKRRVLQHKKNSKNFKKKTTLYKYSRALGGFENFIIVVMRKSLRFRHVHFNL